MVRTRLCQCRPAADAAGGLVLPVKGWQSLTSARRVGRNSNPRRYAQRAFVQSVNNYSPFAWSFKGVDGIRSGSRGRKWRASSVAARMAGFSIQALDYQLLTTNQGFKRSSLL